MSQAWGCGAGGGGREGLTAIQLEAGQYPRSVLPTAGATSQTQLLTFQSLTWNKIKKSLPHLPGHVSHDQETHGASAGWCRTAHYHHCRKFYRTARLRITRLSKLFPPHQGLGLIFPAGIHPLSIMKFVQWDRASFRSSRRNRRQ